MILENLRIKLGIKKMIKHFFEDKNIKNYKNTTPKILNIDFAEYGFNLYLDIQGICSYKNIEENLDYLKALFKAVFIELKIIEGNCKIYFQLEELKEKKYKKIKLDNYKLLVGFNHEGNLIIDMKITPHLFICGLSNQGKTQLSKTILNNLDNADKVVLNGYLEDFKGYRLINTNERILKFLTNLIINMKPRKSPLYIVIDELIILTRNKTINEAITNILAIGRHFNIYIIGIAQEGTKEAVKFKNLFNSRITFRQVEESSYRVVLGCSVEDRLNQREFFMYTDQLYKGRSFTN